jgi:excisionase family DNA binding protein
MIPAPGTPGTDQPDPLQLLSVGHAAQLLEVSPSTIWRLVRTRKLVAVRVGDRNTRITRSSISCYLLAQQAGSRNGWPGRMPHAPHADNPSQGAHPR